MRAKTLTSILGIAALALQWTSSARAQVLYGSMTGNVTDASGAAVAGAKVEALNTGTGSSKQTVSDDRGIYNLNDLQPGVYTVTIAAASFGSSVQSGVPVEANTVRRLDAQLSLAQLSQTVTVDASSAVLQTDRADVNAQIRASELSSLPISGARNFQSLFKLIPGVSPPAASHSEAGNPVGALATNVNGSSYNNNNTRIDGTSNNYPWLPEIAAYIPPADAIENVSIATASFDAEQGMAGGSAVNVSVKSGTNALHGSFWEYNTISALKARNFFYYGATNPKYILNQFGATLGGPIKKNKLFYFVDWERTERRQSVSAFQTVATDALKQGNFSASGTTIYDPSTGTATGTGRTPFAGNIIPSSRFNSAAAKMAALLPAANQGSAATSPTNDYFASGSYSFSRDNVDAKTNFNPNANTSVFARYSATPYNIFDPPGLGAAGGNTLDGGQPGTAPGLIQTASIGATRTISPTLIVDGNIGFTRQNLSAQNVDIGKNYGTDVLNIPGTNGPDKLQGGYPYFSISGFSSLGNPNVSNPFQFRDNQIVAALNLSWVRGSHSLRFGAEYSHFGINHFQPQVSYGPRGGFSFTGGITALNGGAAPNLYNAWADFLLGAPQAFGKDTEFTNPATVRETSYGVYARDQWQATRKLTVNYGIRYEIYPFATRDNFGADRYDPATNQVLLGGIGGVPYDTGEKIGWGQLAPRLGLAYRFDEKTVIRAGYGISIDPNNFRSMRDAYPAIISQQYSGANSYVAAGSLTTGIPAPTLPNLSSGSLTLPAGYGTTSFPQTFNRGYIESYNLTVQRDIGWGFNLQAGYVGSRAIRQTAVVNINSSPVGTGNAGRPLNVLFGTTANINLVEPFNTASYNSLQSKLSRRFGRNGTFGITYTFSRAINYADNSDSGITFEEPSDWARNKALAGFDRTHNFQAYGSYALPWGPGQKYLTSGIAGAVAGGWQFDSIISRTSGTPFTVGSAATSLNAPGNTQTADQITPSVDILGGHGPGAAYFDPNAFVAVTAVRYGNSGRDNLRGPGTFTMDASLVRNFRLTERFKLQFRTDAFGLTNTPSFGNPGATASSVSRNAAGVVTNLNGFGIITSASGERQIRFALKVSF